MSLPFEIGFKEEIMAIPTIHVGCTHFARGRLQALVNCEGLYPVACVDINLGEAQEEVGSLEGLVTGFIQRSLKHARSIMQRYT